MRLRVFLLTIILGVLACSVLFFIFREKYEQQQIEQMRANIINRSQAFLLPIAETNYFPIRDFNIVDPEIGAKAAVLFDSKSGRFLFSKNPNQRLPIASITKLMSAIVVLENLDLSETYTVPAEDINVDGKGADFYKNEQFKGIDLFKIMLIKSSNDAALAFASAAKAKGIDFVSKMNEKAIALGMANTKFADPAGLNDIDAFSTASDLIKLVHYTGSVGLISQILKTPSATITSIDGRAHNITSTNQLLGHIQGIVVGKTGYTDNALGTMALEVGMVNNDSIVSIVLGSGDRFGETKKLIQWSQLAYRWK